MTGAQWIVSGLSCALLLALVVTWFCVCWLGLGVGGGTSRSPADTRR